MLPPIFWPVFFALSSFLINTFFLVLWPTHKYHFVLHCISDATSDNEGLWNEAKLASYRGSSASWLRACPCSWGDWARSHDHRRRVHARRACSPGAAPAGKRTACEVGGAPCPAPGAPLPAAESYSRPPLWPQPLPSAAEPPWTSAAPPSPFCHAPAHAPSLGPSLAPAPLSIARPPAAWRHPSTCWGRRTATDVGRAPKEKVKMTQGRLTSNLYYLACFMILMLVKSKLSKHIIKRILAVQ